MSPFDLVWLAIFYVIAMKGIAALVWDRLERKTIGVLRECRGPGHEPTRLFHVLQLTNVAMLLGQPWAGYVSSWSLPLMKEDLRALGARMSS